MKCHVPGAEKLTCTCTLLDRNFFSRYFKTSCENVCCKTEKFEICEKISKNKNVLALDRLTHGTIELHPCQYYERRFVFSSSLGQHSVGDHRDKF